MIGNGKIEKILHVTNDYMDDEDKIIETKEDYKLIDFADITLNNPNGEKVTHETEPFPINEVYKADQYIR